VDLVRYRKSYKSITRSNFIFSRLSIFIYIEATIVLLPFRLQASSEVKVSVGKS